MFKSSSFNQPLYQWDVAKVTTMNGMFQDSPFNQDISGWILSASNMDSMFQDSSFNQHLGKWDISSVVTMRNMFNGASAFNQSLYNWDITFQDTNGFNPTKDDVSTNDMFSGASALKYYILTGDVSNDNLREAVDLYKNKEEYDYVYKPITEWNTSSIVDMSGLFKDDSTFTEDIGNWNTQNVRTMSGMFYGAT